MKKKLNEVLLHKPTVEERLKKLEEYIYPEMGNVYGEIDKYKKVVSMLLDVVGDLRKLQQKLQLEIEEKNPNPYGRKQKNKIHNRKI